MKKNIRFDFYKYINGSKGNSLEKALNNIQNDLEKKVPLLHNKKVNGYTLRLRKIEKIDISNSKNQRYYFVGHIEKLDTSSEAYIGKINGKRDTYATGSDEGPIKDIMILFDPFNNIVSSHRTNALSYSQLTSFLSQITQDEELDLSVVVDEAVISKLDKIPGIKEIEYSVATPNNWDKMASKNRSVSQDLELAKKLNAGRMKVLITPQKGEYINKNEVKKKVRSLLPFAGQEVSVLKVKGNVSETSDTLDMINGKIDSLKVINLTKGKKLTFSLIGDKIQEAYLEKKDMFDNMFIQSNH